MSCVSASTPECWLANSDTTKPKRKLELASILHDVGKIGIPDAILLKPGKLEPDEFEVMKRHSGFGNQIVQAMDSDDYETFANHAKFGSTLIGDCASPLLRLASRISLTHHEKWDGSGYPLGLAGEEIPLEGRIVAVADVFDALGSRRPYKEPFSFDKCVEILREGRGKHFDPQVIDAFLSRQSQIAEIKTAYADDA